MDGSDQHDSFRMDGHMDTWMHDYKKNSISPATYSSYRININEHIRPAIGSIQLQKLRPEQIQKLLNSMGKSNSKRSALASATIIKVKNILSGAMEQTIKNRIIQFNPARAVTPPKLEQDEILALTWDCVDFENQSITVKSSMSRIKDPDTGITDLRFKEPKTKSGRRKVPIVDSMISVLNAHKERQRIEKSQAAGLEPITFHALRHTFATRMLEAEVNPKVVQEVLGHADVTLTLNTYSHVVGTTAHEQMAKTDGLFKQKDSPEQAKSILTQLDEAKEIVDKSAVKKVSKNEHEL